MATINFSIRSSQKGTNLATVRVRLTNGRRGDSYATTNYVIPVCCWDEKKQTVKQSGKFDESFTIEMAQDVIDGLGDIKKLVIATYNKTANESISSKWLQNVIDIYFSDKDKEIKNNSTVTIVKKEQVIEPVKIVLAEEVKKELENERITLNRYISTYIEEVESGKRLTIARKEKFAEGTIKTLKGFRNQFNEYQEVKKKTLDFDDITLEFYKDFTQYFSIDKGYSLNTVGKVVQNLITFMLAAYDDKLHKNLEVLNRKFKVDTAPVDNVYLTVSRLNVLFELDRALFAPKSEYTEMVLSKWKLEGISGKTREAWGKALDVFLVGCWTGQRYSDYSRVSMNMIVEIEEQKFVKLFQVKTKKFVYIPVVSQVEAILDRNGGILPKVFEQKVNDYIKLICERVGFTEKVTIIERKGGKTTLIDKRFCEMVKTHTARRSFASNMKKAGASLASIADITGHSSEAMLRRYLKLDEVEKAQLAAKSSFFQSA